MTMENEAVETKHENPVSIFSHCKHYDSKYSITLCSTKMCSITASNEEQRIDIYYLLPSDIKELGLKLVGLAIQLEQEEKSNAAQN